MLLSLLEGAASKLNFSVFINNLPFMDVVSGLLVLQLSCSAICDFPLAYALLFNLYIICLNVVSHSHSNKSWKSQKREKKG